MSIYKKLSKMVGCGSLEEKLYALLQTDTYKTDLYQTWDLGEGMAVLHKNMMGWYKPRLPSNLWIAMKGLLLSPRMTLTGLR